MTSCLLVRRKLLKQFHGLDENFPIYYNDVDLSLRMSRANWKTRYLPDARVFHRRGASTGQVKPKMIWEAHRSLFRFLRKHDRSGFFWLKSVLLLPMLELTALVRVICYRLSHRGRTGHVAACVTPAVDGSTVRTDTPAVKRIRRTVLELLIARCPEVAILRELGERLGVGEPPYPLEDETCFLCGICVRACREIVGAEAIGFADRGAASEVLPPFAMPSARCISCGTCTTVCPARTFELSKVDAVRTMHGDSDDVRTRTCVVCDEHYTGS